MVQVWVGLKLPPEHHSRLCATQVRTCAQWQSVTPANLTASRGVWYRCGWASSCRQSLTAAFAPHIFILMPRGKVWLHSTSQPAGGCCTGVGGLPCVGVHTGLNLKEAGRSTPQKCNLGKEGVGMEKGGVEWGEEAGWQWRLAGGAGWEEKRREGQKEVE